MRAVQYRAFGGPIEVAEVAEPRPGEDGVLIEVDATGLCRSDWHGWQGHDPDIVTMPHIPGHELAGRVVEIGAGVRDFAIGDRVTVPFVCGCGKCGQCLSGNAQVCPEQWQPGFSGPGSFAERVAIPRADANLVRLPDEVSMDAAASLGCRFATAYRAVTRIGQVQPGERIVVLGCGGVGLSILMIAIARGAHAIAVDPSDAALALARELGAGTLLAGPDLAAALAEELPGGADASFDAVGSVDACRTGVQSLRPRGRHVQVGLLPAAEIGDRATVPMHLVIGQELAILGSHGMAAGDYPELVNLVADGTLDPLRLLTRVISLDQAPAALASMATDLHPGITLIRPGV